MPFDNELDLNEWRIAVIFNNQCTVINSTIQNRAQEIKYF